SCFLTLGRACLHNLGPWAACRQPPSAFRLFRSMDLIALRRIPKRHETFPETWFGTDSLESLICLACKSENCLSSMHLGENNAYKRGSGCHLSGRPIFRLPVEILAAIHTTLRRQWIQPNNWSVRAISLHEARMM